MITPTPKEKAKELADIFNDPFINKNQWGYSPLQKWCASKVIEQALKITAPVCDRYEPYYLALPEDKTQMYWMDVSKELDRL
jgi:hypothetical protein